MVCVSTRMDNFTAGVVLATRQRYTPAPEVFSLAA
jgi:hypothetical protein